jgi:hypothetical protein
MDYNEVHPAIGIERNGLELALTVNSLNRPSVMIAKLEQPYQYKGFNFGYRLGVGTGYEPRELHRDEEYYYKHDNGWNGLKPIAQLVASTTIDRVTIDFGFSTVSTVIFKINIL